MAILQELQRLGKTILISSHILSELETLCNRVAIIERGRLIYSGAAQGLGRQMGSGRVFKVQVIGDPALALTLLRARPEIREATESEGRIKVVLLDHQTNPRCIADSLVQGGVGVVGLQEEELGLEDVFLEVTQGETQ
jgi:ABC-2 type transport system ATP-binding protein